MKISPTVGRVVWYWRDPTLHPENNPKGGHQPEAATVAFVHSDSMVNLHVIDHNGVACSNTSVPLRQAGEGLPNCSFCEWMPYQIGQAKQQHQQQPEQEAERRQRLEAELAKDLGGNKLADQTQRVVSPTPTPVPPEPIPDPPGKQRAR